MKKLFTKGVFICVIVSITIVALSFYLGHRLSLKSKESETYKIIIYPPNYPEYKKGAIYKCYSKNKNPYVSGIYFDPVLIVHKSGDYVFGIRKKDSLDTSYYAFASEIQKVDETFRASFDRLYRPMSCDILLNDLKSLSIIEVFNPDYIKLLKEILAEQGIFLKKKKGKNYSYTVIRKKPKKSAK